MLRSIVIRRAAKGLICAALFLCSPAQAYEVYVEASLVYRGHVDLVESQSLAQADLQAYYDWLGEKYNRTYTVSNYHPEPTGTFYYTLNGVWAALHYDLTVCTGGSCTTNLNYGSIRAYAQCQAGWGIGYHDNSPTNRTAFCQKSVPDAHPPPKCDSCIGNPIYPSTGQKVQVEADYIGLPGLNFARTYRSDLGYFASATTSAFADYSLPYGNTTQNCLAGYRTVAGPLGTTPFCWPYIGVAQLKYQVVTSDVATCDSLAQTRRSRRAPTSTSA